MSRPRSVAVGKVACLSLFPIERRAMERDKGCWRAGKPSTGKGGKSLKFLLNDGFPLAVSSYQNTAMLPHHQHTSYLSKRRRFCLWSNKFHVDQNCSTWQAILHHMTKLFVMSSNDELLHICKMVQFVIASHNKIAPHDKFTLCAVFLWFTLF